MPATQRADVLVIGGGPAGTSLARLLAFVGQKVTVLERSDYKSIRVGETLSPRARVTLSQLGVWERFLADGHLPSPGILSVWGSNELYENDFIFNPFGCGWHLNRCRFDEMLALAAEEAGVMVHRATRVVSCDQQSSGSWQIEAICKGQPLTFSADFLVEAVGRGVSVIRQSSNSRNFYDRLIGLVKYLRLSTNTANFDCRTLVEASENGWWYSAYLPSNCLIVVYLTDADRLPKKDFSLADVWWQLLQQVPHTLARVQLCEYNPSVLRVAANSYQRNEIAGNRWLALGDASCAFDPLSSQGITKALEFSFIAAKAIVNYQSGDESALQDYTTQVGNAFIDYLNQRQTYYSREKRWSKSIFWQRRQGNIFHPTDLEI